MNLYKSGRRYPTSSFTTLELHNPWIDVVQQHRKTDFKALKLGKVSSGMTRIEGYSRMPNMKIDTFGVIQFLLQSDEFLLLTR